MSSYEFWEELGKIFNAVVAYQEKSVEFNKRFISPWIRLGNVFEKQDRNKEAISAYERAIEIDGSNAQNWFELGNIHFKMENYGEAIGAFNRAIELDAGFGWAYCNLALALVTTGETEQAIPLYQKSLELLEDPKDKAVAWNRLGNAYRKLNQYEQALEAFHQADELDRENAGFRDDLDEVAAGPILVQAGPDGAGEPAQVVNVSPIELIVAESRAAEAEANADASEKAAAAEAGAEPAPEEQTVLEAPNPEDAPGLAAEPIAQATAEGSSEPATEAVVEAPNSAEAPEPTTEPVVQVTAEASGEPATEAEIATEAVSSEDSAASAETTPVTKAEPDQAAATPAEATAQVEETVTVVVQDSTETFTETLPVVETATETTDATLSAEDTKAEPDDAAVQASEIVTSEEVQPATVVETAEAPEPKAAEPVASMLEDTQPMAAIRRQLASEEDEVQDPAPDSLADQLLEAEPALLDVPQQAAYEEYLKDTSESGHGYEAEEAEEAELPGSPEPVATIDPSGDLQIEMDTKNAHVWNELGNVYFNSCAYDDAIVAYSKAIELDRWFAWPYSNLALAYVQKRRYVEAILLYQRSIELFSSDKDKAISWNRLGNVYRRLNDYENAIAAYQRADALDPDNSTLSLQSRFSLLGSYAMEQKPSYVS